MSLDFGFGLYDTGDAAKTALWDKLYANLSEADKTFYNDHLCWILMMVDVGKVTEETIPHIINRLKVDHEDYLKHYNKDGKLSHTDFLKEFEDYLKRFIGYCANVHTLTSTEYAQKILKRAKRDLRPLTRKEIDKIKRPDPATLVPTVTVAEVPA